jgi:AmpD protein
LHQPAPWALWRRRDRTLVHGRDNCNDFSIGIELEGIEGGSFEARQYEMLVALMHDLAQRYRVTAVAGHEHVAPGRKVDPGGGFEWHRLIDELGWPGQCFPEQVALRG